MSIFTRQIERRNQPRSLTFDLATLNDNAAASLNQVKLSMKRKLTAKEVIDLLITVSGAYETTALVIARLPLADPDLNHWQDLQDQIMTTGKELSDAIVDIATVPGHAYLFEFPFHKAAELHQLQRSANNGEKVGIVQPTLPTVTEKTPPAGYGVRRVLTRKQADEIRQLFPGYRDRWGRKVAIDNLAAEFNVDRIAIKRCVDGKSFGPREPGGGGAKLDPAIVKTIRQYQHDQEAKQGYKLTTEQIREVATLYAVSPAAIRNVLNGDTWLGVK